MNARLLPRMAAARIQGPDCGEHGECAAVVWMTASSRGKRIRGMDAGKRRKVRWNEAQKAMLGKRVWDHACRSGLAIILVTYPPLAWWACFCRRFAAGAGHRNV